MQQKGARRAKDLKIPSQENNRSYTGVTKSHQGQLLISKLMQPSDLSKISFRCSKESKEQAFSKKSP